MNLVLDVGNTKIKWALFDVDKLLSNSFFNYDDYQQAIDEIILLNKNINSISISSVVDFDDAVKVYFEKLTATLNVFKINSKVKLPFQNRYKSETLGLDRLCNIMAVSNQNAHCLVIDIGTCLKFDFLHHQKGYLGGSISPGLPMRLKSMHDYTSKLPNLIYKNQHVEIFGLTTEECMIYGAYNGVLSEIKMMIGNTKSKFGESVKVFLTGGDAVFFEKDLKNNIFVDKFLTLRGVNEIFTYNLR